MSELIVLHHPHFTAPIHCRVFSTKPLFLRPLTLPLRRRLVVRAFNDSSSVELKQNDAESSPMTTTRTKAADKDYPSGEFQFREPSPSRSLFVKLCMLFAPPWTRVKKRSVLTMTLRGEITDQLKKSRFSSALSLPQICENLVKAAYDPRISGVYLHIDNLECGWAKAEEIRRHILDFQKSGKFIVAYVPTFSEKEYYLASACQEIYAPPSAYFSLFGVSVQASFIRGVLENIGVEPQVERIGKYKSYGDRLARKTMSEENREMLTALLDNVYGNWLDVISSTTGKKREDIEKFLNEGVYQVEKLKEEGWITNIQYDDEVISMLKERMGLQKDKKLPMVNYRKYSRVKKWTLGLSGGKDKIALIRATGSISHVQASIFSGSDIIAEQFIEKIRKVRESEEYKAVIIRIDSPGGDALASDLMWREIRLLAAKLPVVASMSDVAASGGYYMAMAADAIVAENLTLTGSIGIVTGKFNLGNLYKNIGFNKEIISRGKYAEILAAEQRPFTPEEAELFAKFAKNFYKQFRDKAALSRSMTVDKMEEVAQGRVWAGKDAVSRGLVDAIGGLSRAVAIAKLMANIPQDTQVTLEEPASRFSLVKLFSDIDSTMTAVGRTVKTLPQDLTFSNGVQTRMDDIMFQGSSNANLMQYESRIIFLMILGVCLRFVLGF